MRIDLLITAILSAIIGAAFQHIFTVHLWPNRHRTYSWWFALRNHRKYGEPCPSDLVLDRVGYSLGYSFKYRAALWVSYILSHASIGVDIDRHESFYEDNDIPERYRVAPDEFTNSGYDKGHLAPSASIDFSRKSNHQTFAMSNICFQDAELNRQAWGRLESLIRKMTFSKGKLAVVAGPVFGKRNKRIHRIAVPHSFYKVIYSFRHRACIAFLFPNEAVENSDLWQYACSVVELERKLGYTFFQSLGDDLQAAKQDLDVEFWRDITSWNRRYHRNVNYFG